MRDRANIFDELDVSGFIPEPAIQKPAPEPQIRAAAEAQNFQSREPKTKHVKKADRRYRTGRNIPLATKISANASQLLYGIHAEHKAPDGHPLWTIGQIIEFGLQAFQRELDNKKAQE
jgi:hypothetical protein